MLGTQLKLITLSRLLLKFSFTLLASQALGLTTSPIMAKNHQLEIDSFGILFRKNSVVSLCTVLYIMLMLSQFSEYKCGDEVSPSEIDDRATCQSLLGPPLIREIGAYKPTVRKIVMEILQGKTKGVAWKNLADFVDKFEPRMAGSEALEEAIDYLAVEMGKIGFSNIHTEPVIIPKWLRGPETARLVEPWEKQILSMAGLYSISTPPGGIKAEVVMMDSVSELITSPDKFKGKIVAINTGDTSNITIGNLGKAGALAALTRSPSFGIYGIHRKLKLYYDNSFPRIPVTQITSQDMDLFESIYKKGESKLVMQLEMDEPLSAVNFVSRNLVGDYFGREKSDEIFGLGGHMDSWDIGQGAQDDGYGVILALDTVKLLKRLNLQPRRTIRTLLWTSEEIGLKGSLQYIKVHSQELDKWQAVMEADTGCISTTALLARGSDKFVCIGKEIARMIQPFVKGFGCDPKEGSWASDLNCFADLNIPTLGFGVDEPKYRWYKHTNADSMSHINSKQLDRCFATFAAVTYVLADMETKIPTE